MNLTESALRRMIREEIERIEEGKLDDIFAYAKSLKGEQPVDVYQLPKKLARELVPRLEREHKDLYFINLGYKQMGPRAGEKLKWDADDVEANMASAGEVDTRKSLISVGIIEWNSFKVLAPMMTVDSWKVEGLRRFKQMELQTPSISGYVTPDMVKLERSALKRKIEYLTTTIEKIRRGEPGAGHEGSIPRMEGEIAAAQKKLRALSRRPS